MNSPPTWNIGSAVKISSSAVTPKAVITLSALNVAFSCVNVAPFGRPVVPEVKAITTGAAKSRSGSAQPRPHVPEYEQWLGQLLVCTLLTEPST